MAWMGYRAHRAMHQWPRLLVQSGLQNIAIGLLVKATGALNTEVETANADFEHRPRRGGGCFAIPLLAAYVVMPLCEHRYS
ncbi:hypothetical protein XFF6990_320069 [Xanthomonas citri pv. fuscans]|uniref:Uncharacterized protein n=1 Tax=Xanthomonas campestris pv. phaseoli TaxID=317013 RepID=A0A7Z7NFJ7_XANCH|nr:hypothetical protein XFF6990_320069 [Xanthomonas citri pv. fuscans]SOO22872.1 hypothetical protein XFF6991_170042 [Xanthomonas phaseoli pv. phaseoli]